MIIRNILQVLSFRDAPKAGRRISIYSIGSIGILTLFLLGSDFLSLFHIKKSEQALEQLQVQKENVLAIKLKTSLQQTKANQPIFLNQSEAGFTLAKLCETSQLILTHMQLEKPTKKITQNTFEASLNLMGNYWGFLTFFNQLTELAWHVDWQTIHIALNHSKTIKKAKGQSNEDLSVLYPLKINIKLAIGRQYLPTKKTVHPIKKLIPTTSPFTMQRHIGKLIEDGKTIDLIATKAKEGEIFLC